MSANDQQPQCPVSIFGSLKNLFRKGGSGTVEVVQTYSHNYLVSSIFGQVYNIYFVDLSSITCITIRTFFPNRHADPCHCFNLSH